MQCRLTDICAMQWYRAILRWKSRACSRSLHLRSSSVMVQIRRGLPNATSVAVPNKSVRVSLKSSQPTAFIFQRPSRQPIGTSAAATCCTPLSVASRLNCDAALRVSCTSSRIPKSFICFLVAGETGAIMRPVPRMRRSECGQIGLREHAGISTYQASARRASARPRLPHRHPIVPCH